MALPPAILDLVDKAVPFLDQYFLLVGALSALAILLPIIIIYLVRPKPHKKKIPALMFFLRERAKIEHRSFLRRLFRDPLILLQILIIIAVCAALARPFYNVSENVLVDHVIILIDNSASSQVRIDSETRLERSVSLAQEQLSKKNTVITFSNVPTVLGDDLTKEQAMVALGSIRPTDSRTSVFDGIISAKNFVRGKDRVIIYSDFIESVTTKDFRTAKSIVEAAGAKVEFVDLKSNDRRLKNVGIVDLDVKDDKTAFVVENFNDVEETVDVIVPGSNFSGGVLTIKPRDREIFTMDTPEGITEVNIGVKDGEDDFFLDNSVFVVSPKKQTLGITLISNDPDKYLLTALSVIENIGITTDSPPKSPDLSNPVIIMDNVDPSLVLPGNIRDIQKRVDDGATLIIMAQPALFALDFGSLYPVMLESGKGLKTNASSVVQITTATPLTSDLFFGIVDSYYEVKAVPGSIVIAEAADSTPLIALLPVGDGLVMYYGLMPGSSGFHTDIYYPVFWKRTLDLAAKREDLSDLNKRTGDVINFPVTKDMWTPSKRLRDSGFILFEKGIYKVKDADSERDAREFAANLLSERESDLNGDIDESKSGIVTETAGSLQKVPFDLSDYFVLGILVLLFLELMWIKFRGDL
jgi:hypothetical protein